MFYWEHEIALHLMQWNRATSLGGGGSLMGFLEFWQEPGVYSRVMVVMALRNSSLFSDVRTPV